MSTVDRQESWLQRNWKWLLALCCVVGMALFAAILAAVLALVSHLFKGSDPYQHALAAARASQHVQAALGEPIEDGWFPSGNISTSGASGKASLAIGLGGPRGTATLYVEANRSAGQWRYRQLQVELHGSGERLDLVAEDK